MHVPTITFSTLVLLMSATLVFSANNTTINLTPAQLNNVTTIVSTVAVKNTTTSKPTVTSTFVTKKETPTVTSTFVTKKENYPPVNEVIKYDEPSTTSTPKINKTTVSVTNCYVLPNNGQQVKKNLSILLEGNPKLLQYNLTILNGSMEDDSRMYYKPWYWVRTKGRQGQALLMLPFYYSEMSFGMLSIGRTTMNVELKDEPSGCLSNLDIEQRMAKIRELLLNDFEKPVQPLSKLSEREYLCGYRLHETSAKGYFIPECCRHGPEGSRVCFDLKKGLWISILTILLTAIKVVIFLFCPLMLPGAFYSARYILEKYKLCIPKPVEFTVFVTEDKKKKPPSGVTKLTRKTLASWTSFMSVIENRKLVPRDVPVTMHVTEINLRMQTKRVISRSYVPVGLIKFLYDNFIRCRVRRNPPLTTCCKANLFGKWAPDIVSSFTWINFWLFVTKVFLLVMLPFPFYIRLYMYYANESEEMNMRHKSLEIRGLASTFEGNFIAYLSPIHILFLVIYIIFVVEGACIRLLGNDIRNRFKFVLRTSLREMKSVPYAEKIVLGARILIYPLQTFGCFGLIVGVFYWPIAIPIVVLGGIFYFIPMVYLTIRVFLNFLHIIGELRSRRINKDMNNPRVCNKISENHMGDFLPGVSNRNTSNTEGDMARLKKRYLFKETLIQIFTMLCTMATIYATTIIMVECCGFFVELIAFSMMGVIVNARTTMKYVSLVFLLAIYLYDSYNSVHLTYKALANTIIDNAKSRAKNVDEEASKVESMQENTAFIIHAPEDDEEPSHPPTLTMDQKKPRWLICRPILFLDTQDFLYISQKFFEEFCGTYTAGCPGPVYVCLLKATLRFLSMVAFLGFVMIIVMVFSDTYNVSTNNQMLATLAGGMLPFMLRNIVFSKKQSLTISSYSFKYLYDEIVRSYQKKWEIFDLVANLGPAPLVEPTVDNVDGNKNPTESVIDSDAREEEPATNLIEEAIIPGLITICIAANLDQPPSPPADKVTENTTLFDSGYSSKDYQDKPIDLFIDMSINEKQVRIVRAKPQPDQIV